MTDIEVHEARHKGCYIKQRYILCFLSFLGLCNVTFIRNHVGVTTLAMTNMTSINDSQELSNDTHTTKVTLNWSSNQQGYFLGAYFYGYTVGNFPGGMLVNRYGFRKVLSIGIFLSALFEIFIPLAAYQNFYLALAFRSIEGLTHGPCLPGFISVWSNWAPPLEKSILNSVALSGGLFGFLIILPVAGLIVNSFTWEFVFYFSGGLSMLWSCIFFYYVTDTPEINPRITEEEKSFLKNSIKHSKISPTQTNPSIPWKAIFTSKCVYAHFFCHFADAWYQLAIPTLLPTFMVMALNYNVLESSIVMTLPFLLQFFVAVSGGHITDFLRAKKIISTTAIRKINSCSALFVSGALAALSSYCDDGALVVVIFTVGFTFSGLSYPGYLSNALDFAPTFASVIFSISNTFAVSSGALAPLAATYIVIDKTVRSQWQSFFWVTFGINCVGLTAFAVFGSGEQQKWSKIKCVEENNSDNKRDFEADLLPSSDHSL